MQELAGFVLLTSLAAAAFWVAVRYRRGGIERESPQVPTAKNKSLAPSAAARLPVANAHGSPSIGGANAGSTGLGSDWVLPLWGLPFLVLVISSLITAPFSADELNSIVRQPEDIGLPPNPTTDRFFGEQADCGGDGFFSPICYEYRPVAPTLRAIAVPGLLNLLPFLWLLHRDLAVRVASLVAGLLGVFRIAFPIVLMAEDRITAPDGHDYFKYDFGVGGGGTVWSSAVLVSFASLLIWFAFSRALTARRSAEQGV